VKLRCQIKARLAQGCLGTFDDFLRVNNFGPHHQFELRILVNDFGKDLFKSTSGALIKFKGCCPGPSFLHIGQYRTNSRDGDDVPWSVQLHPSPEGTKGLSRAGA